MDKSIEERRGRCSCCQKLRRLMCSHIGLCILLLGYLSLGGIVFSELESNFEVKRVNQFVELRNSTIQKLWNITMDTNILNEKNWTSMTSAEIMAFQRLLYRSFNDGLIVLQVSRQTRSIQWSFTGSFLYSFTLITTIGHGNVHPHTGGGKMGTILYAVIGIPMMIAFLNQSGSRLANIVQYLHSKLCGGCHCNSSGRSKNSSNSSAAPPRNHHHHRHYHHLHPHSHHSHSHHQANASQPATISSSHQHLHDHYHTLHHISVNELENQQQSVNTSNANTVTSNPGHVSVHCNAIAASNGASLMTTQTPPLNSDSYQQHQGKSCHEIGCNFSCDYMNTNNTTTNEPLLESSEVEVISGHHQMCDPNLKISTQNEPLSGQYTCSGVHLNRDNNVSTINQIHCNYDHLSGSNSTQVASCASRLIQDCDQANYLSTNPYNYHYTSGYSSIAQTTAANPGQFAACCCSPAMVCEPCKSATLSECNITRPDKVSSASVLIVISVLLMIAYILIGSFALHLMEKWPLIECVYFCFVSLTTVGINSSQFTLSSAITTSKSSSFGNTVLRSQRSLIIYCLYLLGGFSIIAMFVNIVIRWKNGKALAQCRSCAQYRQPASCCRKGRRRFPASDEGMISRQSVNDHHHMSNLSAQTGTTANLLLADDDFDV